MGYTLGSKSRAALIGVHPTLVMLVNEAIKRTTQDFSVHYGVRTAGQQNALFKKGASKMDGYKKISKHQVQADGYGHAVDLVPYFEGAMRWEWPLIYPIASVMSTIAQEKGVRLRWGGVWDKIITDYDGGPDEIKRQVESYCIRHPGPDFIDGPHYELA